MRFILLIAFILAIPAVGSAATIKVPGDYPTIQQAIDAAVNGDTVLVAPGIYVENIDFKGKAIKVTSEHGAAVTVIDGNQAGSVVTCNSGEGQDSVLEGFTIFNGTGTDVGGGYFNGGGVFCNASSPTITNNMIEGNNAFDGGGICCQSSSLTITNNTITENRADHQGGGIYSYASSPSITNNNITWNWVKYSGGGIYFHDSSSDINNNIITGNKAHICGGIGCYYDSSPTIMNNTITGNKVEHGGGIGCRYNSSPSIVNNVISGNSSTDNGGGIFCSLSSPVIMNNIITGNKTGWSGGGLEIQNSSPVIIKNNTIVGNSVNKLGGGIRCFNSHPTIWNTILWDNSAPTGPEAYLSSNSSLFLLYSDVKGGQGSVHIVPGSTLIWGAGMIDQDPLFVQGPYGFYYLSQISAGQPSNSPCVDSGSDLASNLGMDLYWTRTDGVHDSGIVDMGFHYGDFTFPNLQTDTFQIQESTGGDAKLLLLAGPGNANRNYILLGNVTGTEPGIPLPGGQSTLPINWDIFTNLSINFANTPPFTNFIGTLDSSGSANAAFNTLGPIPGAAGITMNFAYALNGPWDFVSNPVGIEIVP